MKNVNGDETVYTYNALNQLLTENDISYEYDLNGNTVRMISPDKSALYVYNAENRLVRATVQSGNNVSVEEYEYDYAGNRTVKRTEDEYTKYLLDVSGSLTYVLAELNYDGTEKCFYTRGDELVSQERDGKKSYYVYDGHGSVRALFNEEGKVTDRYTYDAFGNLISSVGSTKNDFLFAGEQFDPVTGLYYLRARYMNPSTGSFISMDSYSGSIDDPVSLHKYLYANANPVMNADPSGYFCFADISVTNFINNQLDQIQCNSVRWVLKSFNNLFTLMETLSDMRDAEDWNGFFTALLNGVTSGILNAVLFNRMCEIKALTNVIKVISAAATAIGLASQAQSVADALDEGDVAEAVLRAAHLVVMLGLTFESCFKGDTEVSTENGLVCIEDIEVGDKVWAYDIYTGETALKEVLQVYVKENDTILHLETSNNETIDTTTNHPFYVENEGWVAAGDLEIGDVLYTVDGYEVEVTDIEIERLDEPVLVYNLDVADFDTYFVGETAVLVHNYNYASELSRKQSDQIEQLRNGKDVYVDSVEEARELLRNIPEVSAPPLGRMDPTFSDPKGTYRGDLINKSDPTALVHDPANVPEHPNHARYPHYNIYFPNGKKSAIIIEG